jgi:hypothetical protein
MGNRSHASLKVKKRIDPDAAFETRWRAAIKERNKRNVSRR